ncbi:MAG: hypothetical protein GTO30_10655, partial [Acidobacteria bacterium]|nr:hypothetical protein [Acidobacteriota bacterium]NIQ85889.1 hypothetical protein [Acidobacteriota bacterium]
PFTVNRRPFLPAAHPTAKVGETLRLMLIGRNLGEEALRAEAALTNAGGETWIVDLSPLR